MHTSMLIIIIGWLHRGQKFSVLMTALNRTLFADRDFISSYVETYMFLSNISSSAWKNFNLFYISSWEFIKNISKDFFSYFVNKCDLMIKEFKPFLFIFSPSKIYRLYDRGNCNLNFDDFINSLVHLGYTKWCNLQITLFLPCSVKWSCKKLQQFTTYTFTSYLYKNLTLLK